MAVSKAQMKATNKYNAKAYWKADVRFRREDEVKVRNYAGSSLNKFIVDAVMEKIERLENESND